MQRGYIKLWRAIEDSELWLSEPFTKSQAWIDMLLMANHKKRSVSVRGILVEIGPGQLLAGEEYLAKRWKWSRGKVRRFMSKLSSKTVQQIVQQKNNVCTIVTILNWNLYQQDGTANGTADGTTDGQQTDIPKNGKNGKNRKNKDIVPINSALDSKSYVESFERVWALYHRKGNKQKSLKYWNKLTAADREAIEKKIPKYIKANPEERFRKDFQGWINPSNRIWEDKILSPCKSKDSKVSVGRVEISNSQKAEDYML